jgi:hypothetical protein
VPSEVATATTAVVHPATADGRIRLRLRRLSSWITFALLFAVIGSAVIDGFDVVDIWGVDEKTVSATSESDTELRVRYPTVTRPALATPFEIEVERAGGFENDIELAIDLHYLELWDLNGVYPSPSEERSDGDRIIWTFTPPDGDVLAVSIDARIEPGAQLERRHGSVTLLESGEPELPVRFVTKVRP